MDANIPNLLSLPVLQKTESLRAYMYKTAEANAFPRLYVSSAHAFKQACGFFNLIESRDPQLSKELRLRLVPVPRASNRAAAFLLGREQIPSSCIRVTARQVCPLCLSEAPWCRGEWELKAYKICHVHSIKLVDQCDGCKKILSWDRTELMNCYCGRPFVTATQEKACVWECKWAKQVHLAFRSSIEKVSSDETSVKSSSQMPLSKFLLMSDVVRTVLIPGDLLPKRFSGSKSIPIARVLEDPIYCAHLWETIFLYAAKTPLTLSKMLQLGQSDDNLIRYYKRLVEDFPVPLALKPKLPPPEPNRFGPPKQALEKLDFRSHVARLKQRYGPKAGDEFNPFVSSRSALWRGRL